MSDIRLFKLAAGKAQEITGAAEGLEKSLQNLMEANLETLLGVRFLASEHPTGKHHGGRIDTLGIDENDCPVIIEYKRTVNENVINQGLFYLDWLLDHKAEFQLLIIERFGKAVADAIDWAAPRLICIAADFTKYDVHAVRQINRNIDLLRYRRFGAELLALELVHRTSAEELGEDEEPGKPKAAAKSYDKNFLTTLKDLDTPLHDLYDALHAYIMALGDDVQTRQRKLYMAYRRIKNFAGIVPSKKGLNLYLKLDPGTVPRDDGFLRDVSKIGHWATGDLEVWIDSKQALLKAQPLIDRAYQGS
jgi:predicted transport protein